MSRDTRSSRPASAGTGQPIPGGRVARKGVFRKEGEYWTVGSGEKAFRLKDTKGFGYLVYLLRHPGTEFHVLDLMGGIASQREEHETSPSIQSLPRQDQDLEKAGIHITTLGDAGEMLDERAKAAYRRRLFELREELEEAKELGQAERAEQAEREIDALSKELSRAVGLGGRSRRAASASERARQSVTKAIKAVVEKIAQSDAALADNLSRCIRTGNFCSHQPDRDFPIAWEFAATDSAIVVEPTEAATLSRDPAPAQAEHAPAPPVALEASSSLFSLAERTPFVGREFEGTAIRAVIDRARSGQGSLVMLWDGPGVGKTRLALEMAEYASGIGFRCSVGRCYERDEPFPYLPFVEIIESDLAQAASLDDYRRRMGDNAAELARIVPRLRRIFPDISQPLELPPAQQRRYLFQSVLEALGRAARQRPYLYLLEDLQWADESTLALMVHLANRVGQLPMVIIGTYRSGYSDHNPALVRTLEELIRIGIRPLRLGGLSKDAIAQMLGGLSQRRVPDSLVNAIYEESQGYPFFVEEVYRHLVEDRKVFDAAGEFRTDIKIDEVDVPENVRLIISRRLERLDEHEKQALAAAAVIGRSFSFQLLTAISQVDVDELFTIMEKAQQMGIIVPSSEGPEQPFTFAHELVRQTLLAGISAPRRQYLHAGVADALERLYAGAVNEHAGEIVDHLVKAGSFANRHKLVRWLLVAGKSALDAAAFEEARRNFQSALSHQGALDSGQRADLLTKLAMTERGLERSDAVLANLREALEIYINLGDRPMIGNTCIDLVDALRHAGRFEKAAEAARHGLAYLQADISGERARLFATLGQTQALARAYEPAQEALREALKVACQLSDPKLMAELLGARAVVNFHFFRLREAAADGLFSEQSGRSEAPPWQRAQQLRTLHLALLHLGRLEEALRIADELEPLARKIGQFNSVALCLNTRAWVEFGKAPDLAKLEADYEQFSESGQRARSGFWKTLSEVQLSAVDFFRGNWPSGLLHAQASYHLTGESSFEGLGAGTLFRQMAYAGDRGGAFAILDEKRMSLPRSGQPNSRGSWLMLASVVEGLFMLGEQAQGARLCPLVRELIGTGAVVLWPIFRFTQTVAGVAAAAARQWEAAEAHFQIAMQQAESFPYRLEQAEIRRFQAMMVLDRAGSGDREKAQTLLREALERYTHIGMPRHIEMALSILDQDASA